ncbi:adenylyltransferase/cytidyltransferase family protein [Elusimicrobiota bacterium]
MKNNKLCRGKAVDFNQADKLARKLKQGKQRIVFTNGCYDLLHPGHLHLLRQARKLGDALIVGINSDSSVKRIKEQGRPIMKLNERIEMLSELRCVDFIVPFSHTTPAVLIAKIKPDVLVKGSDWKSDAIIGREHAKRVIRAKLKKGFSTTDIIKRIRKNS